METQEKSLEQQSDSGQDLMVHNIANRRPLIPILFAVAIVFFFFNFFTISCNKQKIVDVKGIELVTGKTLENNDVFTGNEVESKSIPPNIWAIFAFLSAIIGISVITFKAKNDTEKAAIAGFIGVISLVVLQFVFKNSIEKQSDGNPFELDIQFGYWVALFAMGIAGYLSYTLKSKSLNKKKSNVGNDEPSNQSIRQSHSSHLPNKFNLLKWIKKYFKQILIIIIGVIALIFLANSLLPNFNHAMPVIGGIRIEFILFALTLVGVAVFHHKTMYVALIGLAAILIAKYIFMPDFSLLQHVVGTPEKEGEWRILLNLLGLLLGFSILAKYFEESGVPDWLPKVLPDDWKGGLVLLFSVMVISSFLDNIAAAMIGGTIAMVVYKGKVHMGFLAAIVAASNAGGAGSVVGDTTTTLMWIDGVNPLDVTHAYVASIVAFIIFGVVGALQQNRYQKIQKDPAKKFKIDWGKLYIVLLILVCAIYTNWALDFPAAGVWIAILIGSFVRKAPWHEIPKSIQGTIFLVALVTCASLMPVDQLPAASWQTAFSLGFVSAVFDNIPLTKLCLDQGGYDWGILAYTVGFGGSMIWFGSSAGVALSNMYPEAKSVVRYVKHGWHVSLAYIISFFVMLGIVGWHPHAPHRKEHQLQQQELANPPAAAIVNDTTAQVN